MAMVWRSQWRSGLLALFLAAFCGCSSPGERARFIKENDALRRANDRHVRSVAQRDGAIAMLEQQIANLKELDPQRPVDLFAPVKVEIADLSGGADYDDNPGDDGVTVYLRPRDADGDIVKVPGRIKIELADRSVLGAPRTLGVYLFDDPREMGKLWHGKFLTQHYTLKCPFPPRTSLPSSRRVVVEAEFLDYLTGRTLKATREVTISFADAGPASGDREPSAP